MNTFEAQSAFFEAQWPSLRAALIRDGAQGFAAALAAHADPLERRVLAMLVRRGLLAELEAQGGLDVLVDVADVCIAELLAQAEAQPDARSARIDVANVISYNLAADLADPGRGTPEERSVRHRERGLRAAEDCIRWREELSKPATPRANAWWAKGAHELGLGRPAEAAASFRQMVAYGEAAARASGQSAGVDPEGGYIVIFGTGCLGIALERAGDAGGRALLDQARQAFEAQRMSPDRREDAQFGLDQLARLP